MPATLRIPKRMGARRRGEDGFPLAERGRVALWGLRLGKRPLLFAMPLALAALLLSITASAAGGPTIEAAGGGGYTFYWSPSSAEVGAGGAVAFRNASAVVPHGVTWTGGPETPSCSGVPIDEGKTSWSGSCTFAQPGTYAFKCPVHPTEMMGTITVSSSGTVTTPPPPPPPGGESPESPLSGTSTQALKLAKTQHSGSVRGSVALSQAAAGGKLEVDLLARRASLLAAGKGGTVRVGKLIRAYLQAGRVAFTVPLAKPARRALMASMRLRLTVKIVVTPQRGAAVTLTRGVLVEEGR
jgi:plastocyanin